MTRWTTIIRDVVILLVINIIVHNLFPRAYHEWNLSLATIGALIILLMIVFYTVVGCLAKVNIFRYLFTVTIGYFLAIIPFYFLIFSTNKFSSVLYRELFVVILPFGIGGVLAFLYTKKKSKANNQNLVNLKNSSKSISTNTENLEKAEGFTKEIEQSTEEIVLSINEKKVGAYRSLSPQSVKEISVEPKTTDERTSSNGKDIGKRILQIKRNLQKKSTNELCQIFYNQNKEEWTREAFIAMHEILKDRNASGSNGFTCAKCSANSFKYDNYYKERTCTHCGHTEKDVRLILEATGEILGDRNQVGINELTCSKCGANSFEYDSYYKEHTCKHCGYIEKNQRDPEELYRHAVELYNQERYRDSVGIFEETVKAKPNSALVHYLLGATYSRIAGEYADDEERIHPWAQKSREAFNKAVKLDSKYGGLNEEQLAIAQNAVVGYEKNLKGIERQVSSISISLKKAIRLHENSEYSSMEKKSYISSRYSTLQKIEEVEHVLKDGDFKLAVSLLEEAARLTPVEEDKKVFLEQANNLKKFYIKTRRSEDLSIQENELKILNSIGNCELFCNSCGETYFLGDDAVVASVSEMLLLPGPNVDFEQKLKMMEDTYFVMHTEMDEAAKELSHIYISEIRKRINEGIQTNWACHNCSDFSKLNTFPNYFGLVHSLNKDIMYWPMEKEKLAFIIMKNSFIDNVLLKAGSEKVKDAAIPIIGMVAMEKILCNELLQTFDDLLDKDTSKVMKHFKGYEIQEHTSCTELLQANLPSWNVAVSVMAFFYK